MYFVCHKIVGFLKKKYFKTRKSLQLSLKLRSRENKRTHYLG